MVKYNIDTAEGEYQPGSDGLVLKNVLAITKVEDINDAEMALLLKLYEYLFSDNNELEEKLSVTTILF